MVENNTSSPFSGEELKKLTFLEILSLLSPGKGLRKALDDILNGEMGALIVIDSLVLKEFFEGGFRVNCKFTPQRLAELAKMDGAIILSSDLNKILFANTLLVPDKGILSNETGTRHKAAERIAKQTGTWTIAVSERRHKITLYYEDRKYVLQDSESLIRRATETLNILEKQREIFDDLLTNLNVLEITNLVSVGDICSVLQRIEIITKILNNLRRVLIELGSEGAIVKMRIRELFRDLDEVRERIIIDYFDRSNTAKRILSGMTFDSLLDISSLADRLFGLSLDSKAFSKGYRLLSKIRLNKEEIILFKDNFKSLAEVLNASDDELNGVFRDSKDTFKRELNNLREQIMVGKKI